MRSNTGNLNPLQAMVKRELRCISFFIRGGTIFFVLINENHKMFFKQKFLEENKLFQNTYTIF